MGIIIRYKQLIQFIKTAATLQIPQEHNNQTNHRYNNRHPITSHEQTIIKEQIIKW